MKGSNKSNHKAEGKKKGPVFLYQTPRPMEEIRAHYPVLSR